MASSVALRSEVMDLKIDAPPPIFTQLFAAFISLKYRVIAKHLRGVWWPSYRCFSKNT